MPHLTQVVSSSSLLLTSSSSSAPSNSSLLQPLFSALGWQDLRPAITIAEQADQALALAFQQAYSTYHRIPDASSAEQLQRLVDQLIEKLQADISKAQALHQSAQERLAKSEEAGSGGYLVWLKQSAQALFSSDDASLVQRYGDSIQKQREDITTLSALHEVLTVQISNQQNQANSAIVQRPTALDTTVDSTAYRLQNPAPPETRSWFCYPTGACELSALYDGASGFVLQGEVNSDRSGYSVSSAGDINGDGIDDLLVGAVLASPDNDRRSAGKTYVVFGSNQTNAWGSGVLDLSTLVNGVRGFVLQGEAQSDQSGYSVSSAGDINGDGIDDLMVGAHYATPAGRQGAGKTYVVFGSNQTNAWGSGVLDLSTLVNGVRGFVLQGEAARDNSGISISSAGDINGDGIDDLLMGATAASPVGRQWAGKTYVVFGSNQTNAWGSGALDLNTLMDGMRGFVLQGEASGDTSGWSVSSARDINGDGLDDFLVGTYNAAPAGRIQAGKTYVVFGSNQTNAWGSGVLDLSDLVNGVRGFVLQGEASGDTSGWSVSSAGDINGDNIDDLLVGATNARPAGRIQAGKTYVVFGSNQANAWGSGVLDLSDLVNGVRGFVLQGEANPDYSGSSVSSAGDINGDGMDDLLVGAPNARPAGRGGAGKTYVVFGSNQTNAWGSGVLDLSDLVNGVRGFVLQGEAIGDTSSRSVSSAGDINGDGLDDLVLGAAPAAPAGRTQAGKTYVVFGTSSDFLHFTANHLQLSAGETVRLNTSMVALVSDRVNTTAQYLTVHNLTHGNFSVVNAPNDTLRGFYPQNVSSGAVQFIHDGTRLAPTYTLIAPFSNLIFFYSDAEINFSIPAPTPAPTAQPSKGGIHWQEIYATASSAGGVALTIFGYLLLRRRMASHRSAYGFANTLRTLANLEYHDFMRFDGEIYRTRIDAFLREINLNHEDFYNRLNDRERKNFAVCVADILKAHHLLVSSDCGGGLYGFLLCFNIKWPQRLNIQAFEVQMAAIANLAISSWQAEKDPLARWVYDDPSINKKKSTSYYCPRSEPPLPLAPEHDLRAEQDTERGEAEEFKQQNQHVKPIKHSIVRGSLHTPRLFQVQQQSQPVSPTNQSSGRRSSPVPQLFQVQQPDSLASSAGQRPLETSSYSPQVFPTAAVKNQHHLQVTGGKLPRVSVDEKPISRESNHQNNPLAEPLLLAFGR